MAVNNWAQPAIDGAAPARQMKRVGRNSNPVGSFGRSVARGVAVRIATRLVWMALAGGAAFFGWQQFGKPKSREAVAAQSTQVINVNTASVNELMLLPRVNEGMAQRIVAARPYTRVEDLLKVSGIGPKTLDGLRARVVVAPPGK